MAITGAIKDNILDSEQVADEFISIMKKKEKLDVIKDKYKFTESINELESYEIISGIAKNMGMILKGDKLNSDLAAITLLREYRSGRLIDLVIDSKDMK